MSELKFKQKEVQKMSKPWKLVSKANQSEVKSNDDYFTRSEGVLNSTLDNWQKMFKLSNSILEICFSDFQRHNTEASQ